MTTRRRYPRSALAAIGLLGAAALAQAQTTSENQASFGTGLITVRESQRLDLHLTYFHPPDPDLPPPIDPEVPAHLLLVTSTGATLQESRAVVRPGESAHMTFSLPAGARNLVLRAVVAIGHPPDPDLEAPDASRFVSTLEIADVEIDPRTGAATLQTNQILSPGLIKGFNPQPEPPACPTP